MPPALGASESGARNTASGTRNTDIDTAMKQPQDHPRRLLVAVTGLSPQIVTETLYALTIEQKPPFVPTEVRLITTEKGAELALDKLLRPESGWFHRLRADYGLPPIAFEQEHVHVLKGADGQPLGDIRSPEDNDCAADAITDMMRGLTGDDGSALHVSIAGGRKTMGFYLGYALSLYGREQDRLSHVLVNAPYESHPEFFYPTTRSQVIYTPPPHNRPYDTRDAEVTLAPIRFVRLRDRLPEDLREGEVRFSEAVTAAQQAIGPAELVIDLPGRRVRAGGKVIKLAPLHLAFLAWLARRQVRGEEWVACPSEDAPEPRHAEAFLAEYRTVIGEMGDDERTSGRMETDRGMSREFFSQTKSRLHTSLRGRLGRRPARPYLVSEEGRRSQRRYGIDIEPAAIRFEPIDPNGSPVRPAATLSPGPAGGTTR